MNDPATQLGEDRESLLSRVRAALGRSRTTTPDEPPPGVDEDLARLARSSDDTLAMFADRARQVGMHVHRVGTDQVLTETLLILDAAGAKRVAAAAGALEEQLNLRDALTEHGLEVVDWRAAAGFDGLYELDAGITDVQAALAESGTLICCTDGGHGRGLSLVPPLHVALVRRNDILPDMIDYWSSLEGTPGRELPSSQVFITGPSKTADIEGELVQGVHGPGQVHIILIEDA